MKAHKIFLLAFAGAVFGMFFGSNVMGFTSPIFPVLHPQVGGISSLSGNTFMWMSNPYTTTTTGVPNMVPRVIPCNPSQNLAFFDDGGDVGFICH